MKCERKVETMCRPSREQRKPAKEKVTMDQARTEGKKKKKEKKTAYTRSNRVPSLFWGTRLSRFAKDGYAG